jgi:hypothetical protein
MDHGEKYEPVKIAEATLFISAREIPHCANRLALVDLAGVTHSFPLRSGKDDVKRRGLTLITFVRDTLRCANFASFI